MDPSHLLSVAVEAACEASRDADLWRDGDWSNDDRNEQWICSYVFARLNDAYRELSGDRHGIYATYEVKRSWIDYHCGWSSKPGPKTYSAGQRSDLGVWSRETMYLEGLVEIKNAPRMVDNAFTVDIERLSDALETWGSHRNGSLKWGMFVFSVARSKSKPTNLQELVAHRVDLCRKKTGFSVVSHPGSAVVDDEN